MSWTVTIPGNPPSGNHANKIGRGFRRGGIAYPKIIKTDEAAAYQRGAALLVRAARPSGWKWDGGRLRIRWKFYLTRLVDGDNLIKVVADALSGAIDVDDRYFNHCVEDIILVKSASDARTQILIDSDPRCCFAVLEQGGHQGG